MAAFRHAHCCLRACSSPTVQRTNFLYNTLSRRRNLLAQKSFSTSRRLCEKQYTKDHEWLELSEDGTKGRIGVSKYAANALGDVVFIELPEENLEVSSGDVIGAVESVKSASDIMSPISGKVSAVNSQLEDKPALINQSAEGDGWIAELTIGDSSELQKLMDGAEYKNFTESIGQ